MSWFLTELIRYNKYNIGYSYLINCFGLWWVFPWIKVDVLNYCRVYMELQHCDVKATEARAPVDSAAAWLSACLTSTGSSATSLHYQDRVDGRWQVGADWWNLCSTCPPLPIRTKSCSNFLCWRRTDLSDSVAA